MNNPEEKSYTYVYLNPLKPSKESYIGGITLYEYEPLYFGKGCSGRWFNHLDEAKTLLEENKSRQWIEENCTNPRKLLTIIEILEAGLEPIIVKILEDVTEREALDKEIEEIAYYGRFDKGLGPLTNMTDGGDGGSKEFEDLSGRKFGGLTVLKFANTDIHSKTNWLCKCDCGNESIIGRGGLIGGKTKSCGCLRRQTTKDNMSKHNMTDTSTHKAWLAMIRQYEVHRDSSDVKMYERWFEFSNFYEDMGENPKDTIIMRINKDDDFAPHNCKWATEKEIKANKPYGVFLTVDGLSRTISKWSEITGLKYDTIRGRIRKAGDAYFCS